MHHNSGPRFVEATSESLTKDTWLNQLRFDSGDRGIHEVDFLVSRYS